MSSLPPGDSSPPHQPHMTSPPSQGSVPPFGPPPQPMLMRPPSDAPSPLGLSIAAVGLLLLCVSLLLPRISVKVDGEDEYRLFGLSSFYGSDTGFGIDAPTVIVIVALLFVVGLGAWRHPAVRWPARIAAVGLGAFAAAFTYHPVTVMRQFYATYDDADSPRPDISADDGLVIAVLGIALLASSVFFMQFKPNRTYAVPPPQPPTPAQGPGTDPTITVTPGQ